MDQHSDRSSRLAALCSLDDPTRAALYQLVVEQDGPVSRDEAARAVGVDRSVAAYHLDKLVDEGLLAVSFARPEGRGGPGAGRPAKHYEPAGGELEVSVPPRDYRLAAELLARAVAADESATLRGVLDDAARTLGTELAETGGRAALWEALERLGYRPYADEGVVRLRNCPFHRLAQRHTELVCGMNLALMSGLAEATDDGPRPRLDPAPGRCCVAFDRSAP